MSLQSQLTEGKTLAWFDHSVRPKMKSFVQCKFGGSNDVKDLQVLSRAGKSSGIYKS